jgi:DNA-binding IclR family transcriptional regulator
MRPRGADPADGRRLVPAVDRAVRILAELGEAGTELRLSDLTHRLELSKSTLSDLLNTLDAHGLVERDPASRAYRLGHALVELGVAARGGRDLVRDARPALVRLRDQTAETAILHVPSGRGALVLDAVESEHQLKVVAPAGHRLPPLAGAVAKVFLAALPDDERAAAVGSAPLPSFTERTVTDPQAYLAVLADVRRDGCAIDDEEYLSGVRAVCAPLVDHARRTVGALTVVGASSRLGRDRLAEIATEVTTAAGEVSRRLGAGTRENGDER